MLGKDHHVPASIGLLGWVVSQRETSGMPGPRGWAVSAWNSTSNTEEEELYHQSIKPRLLLLGALRVNLKELVSNHWIILAIWI